MTKTELDAEWLYLYTERIALLCPDLPHNAKPERWAVDLAAKEADEAIAYLRLGS